MRRLPSPSRWHPRSSASKMESSLQVRNRMSLSTNTGAFTGDMLDCKEELSEKASVETEAAHLKWENQKLASEFAEKVRQLQASHEREKETWRKTMQQSLADSYREWQQRELEQRKNYEAREAALQQQVRKLEADLVAKGQRICEMNKCCQKHKEKMQQLLACQIGPPLQETQCDIRGPHLTPFVFKPLKLQKN
nr:protein FAM184B-like [Zootoca vivipara]